MRKQKRMTFSMLVALPFVMLVPRSVSAAEILFIGSDTTTDTEWRSTGTAKNATFDPNGDNAYGSDGYLIVGGDGSGDTVVTAKPSYFSSLVSLQVAYARSDLNKIDDPREAIGVDVPLLPNAGGWYYTPATAVINLTFNQDATVVVTIPLDPKNTGNPPSVGIQQTVGGSTSGWATMPADLLNNVEYVFFRVTASAGDSFNVIDGGDWNDTIFGAAFEAVPPDNTAPAIDTLSPADNATGVARHADLVATFDEIIALTGSGTITITDLTDGSGTITLTLPTTEVTVSGTGLTIDLNSYLDFSTEYEVTIDGNALEDIATTPNAYGGTSSGEWTFTTEADPGGVYVIDSGFIMSSGGTVTDVDLGYLDFTDATKLVMTVGVKGSALTPDNQAGSVTYNGSNMTLAVGSAGTGNNSWGWVGIYYLDDPVSVGVGNIEVQDDGYSLGVSALVLGRTDEGVGNIASTNNAKSVDIDATGNAIVVAGYCDGGGSTATAEPPLIELLGGSIGSCAHAHGYQRASTTMALTPTFSCDGVRPSTVAAEFLPAVTKGTVFRFR